MPSIRYISDIHLDGREAIEVEHPGYTSIEAWYRDFVDSWNGEVQSDDSIWVAGDVCLVMTPQVEEVLSALKGHLNLTLGNHDDVAAYPGYDKYFEQIVSVAEVIDRQ